MSDGFLVDGTAVEKHLGTMVELAADMQAAADMAQPLRRDAYGIVGQMFAATIDDTARIASNAVADMAKTFHDNAEALRRGYEAYVATDRVIAEQLGSCR